MKRRSSASSTYAVDHIDWEVALAHYDAERLEAAYETALDIGMGRQGGYLTWFRTIEAEYLTSVKSQIRMIGSFEIEFVEEELGPFLERVSATAREAFDEVGRRFGYGHESKTRVTVLAHETDTDWLYGRHGYCVAKDELYKICIPLKIVGDARELASTLKHEYGHVAVGTLSNRRAPRWLEEAVAMAAEEGVPRREAREYASGELEWLSPNELEEDLRDLDESRDRYLAYVQAGLVGMYMSHLKGGESIGTLLRAYGQPNPWRELWNRLRGAPVEDALVRKIYGRSLDRLFYETLQWVRAARSL